MRRVLCQVAWVRRTARGLTWEAKYHRLAARRGKKRAILAVAHNILVIGFHLIERNGQHRELGPDYLDRLHLARLERSLVRRLENLGHRVILRPAEV